MTTNTTNTTDTTDTTDPGLRPDSLVILWSLAIVGAALNSLSLSYYINVVRGAKGLTKLLMILNVFDLCVCVTSALVSLSYKVSHHYGYPTTLAYIMYIFITLNRVFQFGTGLMTCILSVTRAIAISNPFLRLRIKDILVVVVVTLSLLFLWNVGLLVARMVVGNENIETDIITHLSISSLRGEVSATLTFVVVVLLFNIGLVTKMLLHTRALKRRSSLKDSGPGDQAADYIEATVTVTLLSTFYCVLNIFYVSVMMVTCVLVTSPDGCYPSTYLIWFATWVVLPINSCINPVIYLCRSRGMRDYLRVRAAALLPCVTTPPSTEQCYPLTGYSHNETTPPPTGRVRVSQGGPGGRLSQGGPGGGPRLKKKVEC